MAENFKSWVKEMEKRRILEWRVNFIFDFIFFCAVYTFIICMLYFWSFFELRGTHLSGVELIILLCSWYIIIIWPCLFVVLFMRINNIYFLFTFIPIFIFYPLCLPIRHHYIVFHIHLFVYTLLYKTRIVFGV